MDIEKLNDYKQRKLVKSQSHPTKDLLIWNYTEQVQLHGPWDDITSRTRGLVTDSRGNIVAHSFRKFHNIEQNIFSPTDEYTVYAKLDGSLGILFWYEDEWIMCSRGSFTSDQAMMARQMLVTHDLNKLDKQLTYNFEIIYPENRIVVDYGDRTELVFLAAFNKNGEEVECDDAVRAAGFAIVHKYKCNGDVYQTLKKSNVQNAEGYVVRFSNGDRIKIKFDNYLRLHRIVTNMNALWVWEMMRTGESLADHLDSIPDEFQRWVESKWQELQKQYDDLYNESMQTFYSIVTKDRKVFAQAVKKTNMNPKLLFALYDGRCIRNMILNMIRPVDGIYDAPFSGKVVSANKCTEQVVIILVGPSSSGKSTWTKEHIQSNPTFVRINRDTLRQQLFGYTSNELDEYYKHARHHEREKIVTMTETILLRGFIAQGKNVIIDNTNLKKAYIDAYCKCLTNENVKIEFKVFDTPVEECIRRDLTRDRVVGDSVIREQFKSFEKLKSAFSFQIQPSVTKHIKQCMSLHKGYVFDIDGTLADNSHRDPYDWSKVMDDTPIEAVKETLISHHCQGYRIILCSGRDGICYESTVSWLLQHQIPYDELHMRPKGIRTPDYQIKEVMWKDIVKRTYIIAMYDDRDCVVKHARACGFQVFQVNSGDF